VRRAACALAVVLAASPALALELGPGVAEVRACVERNLPARSAEQSLVLETRAAAGSSQRIEATLAWKPDAAGLSRVLVRVEAPADLRGSAFLALEREGGEPDLFSYLPELQKVRRLSGHTVSGSLFGTDLSYEDLTHVQGVAGSARIEKLPEEVVEGRPAHVLRALPAEGVPSAYAEVRSWVDVETCVVRRIEFRDRPDAVAKELVAPWEDVTDEGGRWLPRVLVVRDLADGGETRLTVEKARYDVDLPERLFSQGGLAARGR
jgi:hypothetical protein